tara:strand:+ start:4605 stop:5429 length:825 start_codon:yes stop_codon:yes gene_type:complete
MARNYVDLSQVVNDFILTLDTDDYVSNASDTAIRSFALRGVREMGFDMLKVVRSLKVSVNSNNTATLPDDYVDWSKVGVVGDDGLIYVLGENKNINYSQKYSTSNGVFYDSDGDGLNEREDSKSATNSGSPSSDASITEGMNSYIFRNFVYENNHGRLYGLGGGHHYGEFRVNLDQNRIELKSNSSISEIVIEYVADEGRSTNPRVHVYAEEALRSFIYYKLIERKSSVPANEKARARQEYYNERRKANARMKSFTKEEALKTIRKNYKQAPKG